MEYDLNLREYWRIVRKRKVIILFAAIVTGIFSLLTTQFNKPVPVYQSTATVKIEKSSTTTGLYLAALTWSGGDFLETQRSIITSYPVLEKTAKELGLIADDLDSTDIRSDSELIKIVLNLKGSIQANRDGNSNLVNITASSTEPKKAQDIANTLARVYTAEHTIEVNKRNYESRSFIESQLESIVKKLKDSEEKLKQFREQENVISLDSQTSSLLVKLTSIETEYQKEAKAAEDIERMYNRITNVQELSADSEESFFVPGSTPVYNSLNTKLVAKLMDKETLLLTYTENHPKVIEINSQIKEITKSMAVNLKDILEIAHSKTNAYLIKIDEYQSELNRLPSKGLKLARLQRNVSFNEKTYQLLEEKLQEAKILEAAKIEEVIIVKPALEPSTPIEDVQIRLKVVMGILVGMVIGLIFAFIYETFDTSIGAVQEIEEFLDVQVLGIIPEVDEKSVKSLLKDSMPDKEIKVSEKYLSQVVSMAVHFMPNSSVSECYRSIRTNVQFAGADSHVKTIAFTSSVANEGKSTTAINVAITLSQAYNRVLLVDADLRKPDISEKFGIPEEPGLTEVILGSYDWRDVLRNITDYMLGEMDVDDIMMTPGLDNLHIITGGRLPMNPAELLTSDEFDNFFKSVFDEYDVILIDLPPVLSAADTAIICSRVDGVVLVYRAGITARGALRRAKEQLVHARANIIGVILNGLRAEISLDFGELNYGRSVYGYGRRTQNHGEDRPWWSKLLSRDKLIDLMSHKESHRAKQPSFLQSLRHRWKKIAIISAAALLFSLGLYLI